MVLGGVLFLMSEVPLYFNCCTAALDTPAQEREFFFDNLLVRIHFIIVMIRWTGLAPWEFEFPFPSSFLPSTQRRKYSNCCTAALTECPDPIHALWKNRQRHSL